MMVKTQPSLLLHAYHQEPLVLAIIPTFFTRGRTFCLFVFPMRRLAFLGVYMAYLNKRQRLQRVSGGFEIS